MSNVITTDLLCLDAQGDRRDVVVEIDRPYKTPERDWACPVAIRGMYDNLADIHGEDSLQALCLAASLVRTLLTAFVSDGGKIFSPDSESEYDLDAVFSQVGKGASNHPE